MHRGRYPPLTWQTYDIELKDSKLTVLHNGVKIHDQVQLSGADKAGSINLQNHGNPLYFKNIYIKELKGRMTKAPPMTKE